MRIMRKITSILLLLSALVFSIFAQTNEFSDIEMSEKTEKIDEFGRVGDCDLSARIDNFFIELNNKPNSKGYIILYKGRDFLPANYDSNPFEKRIRQQIGFRKYATENLVFIDGGFRNEVTTEFFAVPINGEIPIPTETVEKPEIPTNQTFLFDSKHIYFFDEIIEDNEYILPSVKAKLEAERVAYEEEWARQNNTVEEVVNETYEEPSEETDTQTDESQAETEKLTAEELEEAKFHWINKNFGEFIKKQKNSHGVMIFYADDLFYDISKLQNYFEEGKRKLAEQSKLPPQQIEIIFGGYRESIETEFWIVPKNGKLPMHKPTDRPVETPEENGELQQ